MYAGAGLLFPACLDRSTVSRCVCSAQTSLNCAAVAVRKKTPRIFGEQFQRTGQALSAVWRVSFPFIPSPKDLNAVPAHLVKNTAHMDALLHAPSDTSAAQFIFCRELPSAGVFIPHSSVDRIRYSGESPMNQTWARLLRLCTGSADSLLSCRRELPRLCIYPASTRITRIVGLASARES